MSLMHVAGFVLRVKNKEVCLFTILKLSIRFLDLCSPIRSRTSFAGMTDKDGTD